MGVQAEMKTSDGYTVRDNSFAALIGRTGIAATDLRPAGKVEIGGERYDCVADTGFIQKGDAIKVLALRSNYLVVDKIVIA